MKKSQKWITILSLIIPAIIIAVSLLITGISIKELPLWAIIGIPTLILLLPLILFIAQRSAQQVDNKPLQEKKRKLLIVFGCITFFFMIILVILYYKNQQFFRVFLFVQVLPILIFMLLANYRLFFPKKDELNSIEDIEKEKGNI